MAEVALPSVGQGAAWPSALSAPPAVRREALMVVSAAMTAQTTLKPILLAEGREALQRVRAEEPAAQPERVLAASVARAL